MKDPMNYLVAALAIITIINQSSGAPDFGNVFYNALYHTSAFSIVVLVFFGAKALITKALERTEITIPTPLFLVLFTALLLAAILGAAYGKLKVDHYVDDYLVERAAVHSETSP